jgi:hypothetical protein
LRGTAGGCENRDRKDYLNPLNRFSENVKGEIGFIMPEPFLVVGEILEQ